MKDIADENRRLKQMSADRSLENRALKDVIEKSVKTSDKTEAPQLSDGTVCHEPPPGLRDVIVEQGGIFIARISGDPSLTELAERYPLSILPVHLPVKSKPHHINLCQCKIDVYVFFPGKGQKLT